MALPQILPSDPAATARDKINAGLAATSQGQSDVVTLQQRTTSDEAAAAALTTRVSTLEQTAVADNGFIAGLQIRATGHDIAISALQSAITTAQATADVNYGDLGGQILALAVLPPATGAALNDTASDAAAITPHGLATTGIGTLDYGGAEARPGVTPRLYCSAITGGDPALASVALPGAVIPSTPDGPVVRIVSAAMLAPRNMFPVESGRAYRTRISVRRIVDTPDPLGDGVAISIAWYDANRNPTVVATTVLATLALTVAQGRQDKAWIVSDNQAGDVTPPPGAMWARPYIQTYGATHQTDVTLIDWRDITDAGVIAPNVDAVTARVAAQESLSAGSRLAALEGAVGSPNSLTFPTRAAAITATIPSNILTLTTLGYTTQGIGGGPYRRVASQPAHSAKFQSADGAWWELAAAHPDARQCGVVGDGAVDDGPALAALPAEWRIDLTRGTYRIASAVVIPAILVVAADAVLTGPGVAGMTGDIRRPDLLYPGRRKTLGEVKAKILGAQPVTIDCWGDGLTYGLDTSATGTAPAAFGQSSGATRSVHPWPETLAASLAQAYGGLVTVNNKGWPSQTAVALLARLAADIGAPDIAIVMVGGDDATAGTAVSDHRAAVRQILDLLIVRGAVPILYLPPPAKSAVNNAHIQALAAAQREVAAQYGVLAIDAVQQLDSVSRLERWTDGTNLSASALNELGWHLGAVLAGAVGGDGLPRRARAGQILYPEDLALPGLAVAAGSASGYVCALPQGATQLALWCEDDVVPVVVGFAPDANLQRAIQAHYAQDASGVSAVTLTQPGDPANPRAALECMPLHRGFRVLTLYNPNVAPFQVERIGLYGRALGDLTIVL